MLIYNKKWIQYDKIILKNTKCKNQIKIPQNTEWTDYSDWNGIERVVGTCALATGRIFGHAPLLRVQTLKVRSADEPEARTAAGGALLAGKCFARRARRRLQLAVLWSVQFRTGQSCNRWGRKKVEAFVSNYRAVPMPWKKKCVAKKLRNCYQCEFELNWKVELNNWQKWNETLNLNLRMEGWSHWETN